MTSGASQPAGRGLLLPDRHPEDVVDVAVGVDGGVEAVRAPGADVVVDDLGQGCTAGVDEDEAVVGGEGRHVGEGGAEADPVGDLDEAAHVVDRVEGRRRDLAVPEAVGDGQDVRCHGPPRRARIGARRRRSAGHAAARQAPWDFSSVEGAGAGASAAAEVPLALRDALRLALLHALLELVLGRAEVAGQLGDGGAAEEQHHEDDGHDEQVGTENVSEHQILLHPGPRGGGLGPRLDPFHRTAAPRTRRSRRHLFGVSPPGGCPSPGRPRWPRRPPSPTGPAGPWWWPAGGARRPARPGAPRRSWP